MRRLAVALLGCLILLCSTALAAQAPPVSIAKSQTVKLLKGGNGKKGVIKQNGASYATKPFCTFAGSVTNCTTYLHYAKQCDDSGKCQPVDPERWVSTTRWTGHGSTLTVIRPAPVPEQHGTGLIYPGDR